MNININIKYKQYKHRPSVIAYYSYTLKNNPMEYAIKINRIY